MKKILIKLQIVQVNSNKLRRLNPYNPLSYIIYIGAIIYVFLMYGITGFNDRDNFFNPFKWN